MMKQLAWAETGRQWAFEHEGIEYSVINLTIPPGFRETMSDSSTPQPVKASLRQTRLLLVQMYEPYVYDLASLPKENSKPIEVHGRYKSLENAKLAIFGLDKR